MNNSQGDASDDYDDILVVVYDDGVHDSSLYQRLIVRLLISLSCLIIASVHMDHSRPYHKTIDVSIATQP